MKRLYTRKQDKKPQLERLLQNGTVMLFIDSRRKGVQVPEDFMNYPQLALNFDYAFQIPDFRILEGRIEATLEFFGNMNFSCVIPWDAVYAMKSETIHETVFFPEDIPTDLAVQQPPSTVDTSKEKKPTKLKKKPKKERPKLVAVSTPAGKKKRKKKPTKKVKKKPTKKKKGSHLKLVK